ncbi:hypothetical protein L596_014679 [Steinernema carpocapsae]|uniref:TFIIS N-terminal domain-containing protein n=1 Tax=Steinernema carpocapsae TaxID=34508 RepID=A0A4V6A303_STECR|nr:hypothetical protein L596_014679 [Steinernema carpocapsae]
MTPTPTQDVSDVDVTMEGAKKEAEAVPVEDNAEKEDSDDDEVEVPMKKRRVQVDSDDEEEAKSAKSGQDAGAKVNDSDQEVSPSKRRVAIDSDDEEEDVADANERQLREANPQLFKNGEESSDNEEQTKELMANIFGEDSDDSDDEGKETEPSSSKAAEEEEDEPKFIGREKDDDEEDNDGREWDFDVMMRQRKKEGKKRRRRKDGTVDLISDMDDQIKELVENMQQAANQDRVSNAERRPALKKRKMLAVVRSTLLKADLFDTLLDNHMMSAVSEWLAPLPDKSLPSLEIRSTLLKILQGFTRLEQGILKQSGLGKAVMLLFKHPRETKENKEMANRLIREWSRPIFQLDADMRTLDKEERTQRDFEHVPEVKRKNMTIEEFQLRHNSKGGKGEDGDSARVGDKGFVGRARVPRPSTRDYIVRPKYKTDQQFREATKNRSNSRYDRAHREFLDRTKKSKTMRAVTISLEGRKMD